MSVSRRNASRRRASSLVLSLGAALALVTGNASAQPAVPAPPAEKPASPVVIPLPDTQYSYQNLQPYPSLLWLLTQALPSPEIGGGSMDRINVAGVRETSTELAFGLRWQVTPILWSWGTNRHISRWRFFVVDPLARHAGSLELNGTLEYFWGHVDRAIARPGIRANFPLYGRGEYLSTAIGTSMYSYDGTLRAAYDAGLYTLFGLFGVQVTVAPTHDPLNVIGTFRIRYF